MRTASGRSSRTASASVGRPAPAAPAGPGTAAGAAAERPYVAAAPPPGPASPPGAASPPGPASPPGAPAAVSAAGWETGCQPPAGSDAGAPNVTAGGGDARPAAGPPNVTAGAAVVPSASPMARRSTSCTRDRSRKRTSAFVGCTLTSTRSGGSSMKRCTSGCRSLIVAVS